VTARRRLPRCCHVSGLCSAGHQAILILLRWFQAKKGPDAFGDGYENGAAVFLYRERVGAAYIFALFKDRDAVAGFVDGTLHVLRFAR
jgi:hypothetical protein